MPEINLEQNGGSGGQQDPDPNVDLNLDSDGGGKGDGGESGDSGGGEPSFIDSIPEADREVFGDFQGKTTSEFAKHYKELQGSKVVIPEAYEAVENIEIKNQGNYDTLTKYCKEELGLTQDQFSKLLPAMVQRDKTVLDEFQKSVTDLNDTEFDKLMADEEEAAKETLTREWGGDFDKKTAAASGLVKALSDDDFVEFLSETGLGNDPRMLKAFYKLSTYISEDNFVEGSVEENDVKRDPQTGAPMLKFNKMD